MLVLGRCRCGWGRYARGRWRRLAFVLLFVMVTVLVIVTIAATAAAAAETVDVTPI